MSKSEFDESENSNALSLSERIGYGILLPLVIVIGGASIGLLSYSSKSRVYAFTPGGSGLDFENFFELVAVFGLALFVYLPFVLVLTISMACHRWKGRSHVFLGGMFGGVLGILCGYAFTKLLWYLSS